MHKIASLFILTVGLPAIVSAQSELAKYQKKIKHTYILNTKSDADKLVQISVHANTNAATYSAPTAVTTKRTVFDLTDKGQKAYIEALNSKAKDVKTLIQSVPTILEPPKDNTAASPEVKMTDLLKKLEIDVFNTKSASNNGRIAQLIVWVTLDNTDNIELEGFNNLTTKYSVLDFGSLSLNRTRGFTLNAGVNLGGTGATSKTVANVVGGTTSTDVGGGTTSNTSNLGATYASTNVTAEAMEVKSNVISLKGSLDKKEASILQNGAPNQDLNDNIDMELVIKTVNNYSLPYLQFKGLFDPDSNKPVTDNDKLTISKGYFTLPQKLTADITAKLNYTFVYRDIYAGENTVIESDDKVNFDILTDRTIGLVPFTLLSKDEVNPRIYHIDLSSDGVIQTTDKKLYLNYYGEHIELLFSDLTSPSDLINWIRVTASTLGTGSPTPITIKGFHLETGYNNTFTDLTNDANILRQLQPVLFSPVSN